MPGLSPIKILGNLKFFSASLKLPTQGKADPAKEAWASKYHKDRDKADMGGAPEVIPPWFMPQKPGYKPHQESCDKIGTNFKDFHDAMLDAVQYSHNMWKLQAKFKDLTITVEQGGQTMPLYTLDPAAMPTTGPNTVRVTRPFGKQSVPFGLSRPLTPEYCHRVVCCVISTSPISCPTASNDAAPPQVG